MKIKKERLLLTLNLWPFAWTTAGIKKVEVRKPSKWIKSRLYWPDGTPKQYNYICFRNGYKSTDPQVTLKYDRFEIAYKKTTLKWGEHSVDIEPGYFLIFFKEIIEIKNFKKIC